MPVRAPQHARCGRIASQTSAFTLADCILISHRFPGSANCCGRYSVCIYAYSNCRGVVVICFSGGCGKLIQVI